MTGEQIEKFLRPEFLGKKSIHIRFKSRNDVKGVFIKLNDFPDLKSKNLWRVVAESKLEEYNKSKNTNLVRIFSGSEITKLVLS